MDHVYLPSSVLIQCNYKIAGQKQQNYYGKEATVDDDASGLGRAKTTSTRWRDDGQTEKGLYATDDKIGT